MHRILPVSMFQPESISEHYSLRPYKRKQPLIEVVEDNDPNSRLNSSQEEGLYDDPNFMLAEEFIALIS